MAETLTGGTRHDPASRGTLFGRDGDDKIHAGGGASVLVGGKGDDELHAGKKSDILIGGAGCDHLHGGLSDDLLIAGFTDFDGNLTALQALQAEWTCTDAMYQQKVAHLTGGATGGKNGTFFLTADTVHDDGDTDTLISRDDLDLIFAHLGKEPKDMVHGLDDGKIVVEI
ncbi:MAG TPA: hypothetical protein VKD72_24005 [Gemmataceae bacterium]|nr:hypothetical protein [Gemmataceae bacterium]